MVLNPLDFKNSLVCEKCLHPKNPRYADSGEGCGAFKIKWLGLLSFAHFFAAGEPHNKNTIGLSCLFKISITASVNYSHPIPAWLAA